MTFLRTPASDVKIPTHICKMCRRTWSGEANIAAHFYRNNARMNSVYDSYCKPCFQIVEVTRRGLGGQRDVPKLIREQYGAGMLRVCQAADISPAEIGRAIVADMQRRNTDGGWGAVC